MRSGVAEFATRQPSGMRTRRSAPRSDTTSAVSWLIHQLSSHFRIVARTLSVFRRCQERAMPIEFVSGDLFVNRVKAEALAHGCNCAGSMGAGIAVGFKERYPAMFEEFKRRCSARAARCAPHSGRGAGGEQKPPEFTLGDVFFWREDGKPAVFNLGTQPRPGRGATYPIVEAALAALRTAADEAGIRSIAMPRIAAGYGGLSWKKVKAQIEAAFADWSGVLYVYEEF